MGFFQPTSDAARGMARNFYQFYQALIIAGFTDDQAMELLVAFYKGGGLK